MPGNNLLFTASINQDMERMARGRNAFLGKDGGYDAAAWLDFATQFNAFMGHPRRPFTPITGDNFKL
ncbi:MAG TPA: hypothetical protein DD417_03830 [Elusimicrobia bacterium]|nr:hypothetical protein [Elusimicrobiota bacterium]